jgi:hypothetical protein
MRYGTASPPLASEPLGRALAGRWATDEAGSRARAALGLAVSPASLRPAPARSEPAFAAGFARAAAADAADVRRFLRGTVASGKALRRMAITAWAVTQTGVWSLARE